MSGQRSQRKAKNPRKTWERSREEVSDESEFESDQTEKMDQAEALKAGLPSISSDIWDVKQELRNGLTSFKDELKGEMKQENANLMQDIEQKLTENHKELQEQRTSITEAQACIAELEECNTEASDMLTKLTKQTCQMQDKLTDLEARSR